MELGKPSQTAISAALFRAAHLHLFAGPTIHQDTFALPLSGVGGYGELRAFAQQVEEVKFPLRPAGADRIQAQGNMALITIVLGFLRLAFTGAA